MLAKKISKRLTQATEQATRRMSCFLERNQDFGDVCNPLLCFLKASSDDVAKKLTLIDFEIFSSVPTEGKNLFFLSSLLFLSQNSWQTDGVEKRITT